MATDWMTGFEFAGKLAEAGIIPENTKRIVIDIPCDGVVTIYYETLADKNTMDVVLETLLQHKDEIQVKTITGPTPNTKDRPKIG